MIRDNSVSFEARGVLAYILSYRSNWRFDLPWLCKTTGLGRDRAYRIVKELREARYCRRPEHSPLSVERRQGLAHLDQGNDGGTGLSNRSLARTWPRPKMLA